MEDARGGGQLNYVLDVLEPQLYSYDLSLIVSQANESFLQNVQEKNIEHKILSLKIFQFNLKAVLLYVIYFIPDVLSIRFHLKHMNTDLAICHGTVQVKAVIASYLIGIKSVWVIHDSQQPPSVLFLFRCVYPFCKHFIYVSERSKLYYEKSFPPLKKRINTVLQSTVSTSRFNGSYTPKLMEWSGLKLVSVCYINKWKGLELLIDISHHFETNTDHVVHFFIIGPILPTRNHYFSTLKKRIQIKNVQNIHFLGYSEEPLDYIKSADAYLSTSIYEASPIAIWESLASGQLTISTDVGDVSKFFEKYNCGYIIDNKKEIKEICVDIMNILSNDQSTVKKNALQVAKSEFHPSERIQEHISFYQSIFDTEEL